MEIRGLEILEEFKKKHPAACNPLERWQNAVNDAAWENFVQLRSTFASADQVKTDRMLVATVFNVGGNKYRLISEVIYFTQRVYVLAILTHAEYSKGRWRRTL